MQCNMYCLLHAHLERIGDPTVGGSFEALVDLISKPLAGKKEGSPAYEQFKKWIYMQAFADEDAVVSGEQKYFLRHFTDDDFLKPDVGLQFLRCYHQSMLDARDLKLPGQEADLKKVEAAELSSNWDKVVCAMASVFVLCS